MKPSRRITLIEIFIIAIVLLVILSMLFPPNSGGMPAARRAQARNDVTQIVLAVRAYEAEYGHLPGANRQAVDGTMLQALIGNNDEFNPRKIVFIELRPYKNGRSGLSNGTYLDPWGGAYQIAFANGTNQQVKAGTNDIEVKKRIAVWNDPNLGKKPSWSSNPKLSRRYVTSWE